MADAEIKPAGIGLPALYTIVQETAVDDPLRVTQNVDLPTVDYLWKLHPPTEVRVSEKISNFRPLSPVEITLRIPEPEWYQSREHAYSLHGREHSLRVALYAEMIGQMKGLSQRQKNILTATAMLHDIARVNDAIDPSHGERAADWWKKNEDVLIGKGIELSPEDKQIVYALCKNHEIPYVNVVDHPTGDPSQSEEVHMLLKYFKVADSLDRFRSPSDEWWPKSSHFDHDPEVKAIFNHLYEFAHYFTLETERYRLVNNKTFQQAIIDVGRRVGLIEQNPVQDDPASAMPPIRRIYGMGLL